MSVRGARRPPKMDKATRDLLRELRRSPTDLAKLVASLQERPRDFVPIQPEALARWSKDDPGSWDCVRAWLLRRGIRIVVA